jgi:predicted nucleic acid-binding protein
VPTSHDAACLDTDMLSVLARGHPAATAHARGYLAAHGRLTFTAISVAERLRGYHAALRAGKAFAVQLAEFERVVASSAVLPLDTAAAALAGRIAAALGRRSFACDLLIAAIAAVHGMALVTRNRRDFAAVCDLPFVRLPLLDWSHRG